MKKPIRAKIQPRTGFREEGSECDYNITRLDGVVKGIRWPEGGSGVEVGFLLDKSEFMIRLFRKGAGENYAPLDFGACVFGEGGKRET